MKALLQQFNKNVLLKLTGYNSIHIGIRILTGVFMSKIMAYYIGAAGMGLLGNLRNFIDGILQVSVLGLDNGLTRSTANEPASARLITKYRTAFISTTIISIVLGVFIFSSSAPLSEWLLRDTAYDWCFKIIACCLPFYSIQLFVVTTLKGLELYKTYVNQQIILSILVFITIAALVYFYQFTGALIGLSIVPAVHVLLMGSLILYNKQIKNRLLHYCRFSFDKKSALVLLSFSIMALVSAIMIPLVNIIVRTQLIEQFTEATAGYWEVVIRISGYYMMFVTSLISLYVLPKLSKNASYSNYRKTITHFYKTILPIVIAGLIAIYLSRELLIYLFFTEEFLPALKLFKWQLAGDFLKVVTTVLAFRFIAINDLKRYLIAEFISLLCFLGLSMWLIPQYDAQGITIAHLITYAVYLVVLIILLRKELFTRDA